MTLKEVTAVSDIAPSNLFMPSEDRQTLVPFVDTDTPDDLFDIQFSTNDQADHDMLSLLTCSITRFHARNNKLLLLRIYESAHRNVETFFNTYRKANIIVTHTRYNHQGAVIGEQAETYQIIDGRYPCNSRNKTSPLIFDLLLQEV